MKSNAYKNNDDAAYIKAYHELNKQANNAQIAMTMKTCEHIELDPKGWQKTDSLYTSDERMRSVCQMADASAIIDLAGEPPKIDEETCIKAFKAKMQKDLEVFRRASTMNFWVGDENQFREFCLIEASKTYEWIK